jgi:hypothetical protein
MVENNDDVILLKNVAVRNDVDIVALAHSISFWPQKLLKGVRIVFGPETAVNVSFWGQELTS